MENAVTVQAVNRYTSLNTYYSPTVRWIPDDFRCSWFIDMDFVCWVRKYIHKEQVHYVANSVGGKKAIYVDASSNSIQQNILYLI